MDTYRRLKNLIKSRNGKLLFKPEKYNYHAKLWFQCEEGHKFEVTPHSILSMNSWCRECAIDETRKYKEKKEINKDVIKLRHKYIYGMKKTNLDSAKVCKTLRCDLSVELWKTLYKKYVNDFSEKLVYYESVVKVLRRLNKIAYDRNWLDAAPKFMVNLAIYLSSTISQLKICGFYGYKSSSSTISNYMKRLGIKRVKSAPHYIIYVKENNEWVEWFKIYQEKYRKVENNG